MIGILLSFVIPVVGRLISSSVAGVLVGYMVNVNLTNGAVDSTIMGLLGGLIESIIIIILGTAFAGIIGLIIAGLCVIVVLMLTIVHVIIG